MNTYGLYQLAECLANEQISMCYSGYISQKVLVGLAASLRTQIAPFCADEGKRQRVFSVFIEQVQNIMRHSIAKLDDRVADSGRFGLVTFGFTGGSYFVIVGNEMLSGEARKLRQNLEELSKLTKKQLLARFRKRMTLIASEESDTVDQTRGPGLGLLEIARHVSQPVEFDMIELDKERSYFVMKARI